MIPLKFPVLTPDGSTITSIPIKAGQAVYIPMVPADRLKCVWGPDANSWRPARWMEEGGLPDSNLMNSGYARLMAFSQGAKACVAMRLAVYQVKVCNIGRQTVARLFTKTAVYHLSHDSFLQGKRYRRRDYTQEQSCRSCSAAARPRSRGRGHAASH